MKHIYYLVALFIWAICTLSFAPFSSAAANENRKLDPRHILNLVDDVYRGSSSHGKMTMRVVTEHWERELTVEFWSKGKKKSLMRILSPLKEKGTSTLMVDDNVWNYLPKVNRVIKVPSSMMGGSWMGSHFTNDDLIKQSRMADDYSFKISSQGPRSGKDMVEITCIPKRDAAVVWGKVVVMVEDKTWIPLQVRYYDEDMKLSRTMEFSNVKTIAERTFPTMVKVIPQDKPRESTSISYEYIQFDIDVKDSFFSIRTLQR